QSFRTSLGSLPQNVRRKSPSADLLPFPPCGGRARGRGVASSLVLTAIRYFSSLRSPHPPALSSIPSPTRTAAKTTHADSLHFPPCGGRGRGMGEFSPGAHRLFSW